MRVYACLGLAAALAGLLGWTSPGRAADVDVAVAFAVDFSLSIDRNTAEMQRNGHAEALISSQVLTAIANNYLGCIAVSYFEWSSPGRSRIVLPWTKICRLADAEAAAQTISARGFSVAGRRIRGGTSISAAIDLGAELLDSYPGKATKKVIDISANGTHNDGSPVEPSRLRAVGKGYTINAIVIPTTEYQHLASYFATNVIGGSQAFVESLAGQNDYTTALRRKLITEISLNVEGEKNHQVE